MKIHLLADWKRIEAWIKSKNPRTLKFWGLAEVQEL
jgi:hypothetical protein